MILSQPAVRPPHRRRIGENPVKVSAHRRNHPVFAVEKIKLGADLAVALVVGVIFALAKLRKLPAVGFALGEHRVAVFRVAGNSRERHHAHVADGANPAGRAERDRMRELPVGHALHRGEHILRRDVGWKARGVGGQRDLIDNLRQVHQVRLNWLRAQLETGGKKTGCRNGHNPKK